MPYRNYIVLTYFTELIGSKKTCGEPQTCEQDWSWNTEACMCLVDYWCEIGCPQGETNSRLAICECVPQCEYDELWTDEPICEPCEEDAKCGDICPNECGENQHYDKDFCMCFVTAQCEKACPEGQGMLPYEYCNCVD